MSVSSSPARKRRRLSSPTYDEMTFDFSHDDLKVVDEIEARYSQSTQTSPTPQSDSHDVTSINLLATDTNYSHKASPPDFVTSSHDNNAEHQTEPSNTSVLLPVQLLTGFASAKSLPLEGFAQSPSPEPPPEQDYDSWFNAKPVPVVVGFQSAKSVAPPQVYVELGFKTVGGGILALSADVLEKAAKRMKTWEEQVDEELIASGASTSATMESETLNPPLATTTPQRPVLLSVENFQMPNTPTQIGFSNVLANTSFAAPLSKSGFDVKGKSKAFKPPSIVCSPHFASPLNPNIPPPTIASKAPYPLSSATVKPSFQSPHPITPVRSAPPAKLHRLGLTPLKGSRTPGSEKKKFSTPFKPGMRPGESGRIKLQEEQEKRKLEQVRRNSLSHGIQSSSDKDDRKRSTCVNLSPPSNRQTLSSSGLRPQSCTREELESMGINLSELAQMTPDLALYYCFHCPPSKPVDPTTPVLPLGSEAALDELLRLGCSLATKPWVENHWGLIMWKLAGMVCLDPDSESNPKTQRWSWSQVMSQLRFRYQKELDGGARPPLRLIASRDSSPSSPMVLCVSKITWPECRTTNEEKPVASLPQLEVTDGWYRLRAEVDEPLARAIRRNVIRVGRKIGVIDAQLVSARKEPVDILEAYGSISLKLSGNSSHLVPWHSKLGFTKYPSISTLRSLTPDGGNVAIMNLEIIKVYPIAYLEFVEDENGKKSRQGPRNEKDENKARDRWRAKRETEESKLRFAMEHCLSRLEGFADRMEQKAGSSFHPCEEDSPPDVIEDVYDQLESASVAEVSAVLARVNHQEAGWLARLIRENVAKEQEQRREEFESELNIVCPPREVRDFRVVITQDVRTDRRPTNRRAQITVWNVLNLVFKEGGNPGDLQEGQKFVVTNLIPTQQSAWMAPGSSGDSEIYLSTRKDSRWTKMR